MNIEDPMIENDPKGRNCDWVGKKNIAIYRSSKIEFVCVHVRVHNRIYIRIHIEYDCVYLHQTQSKNKKRGWCNNYGMRISDWTKQLKLLLQRTSLLFPRNHSSSMLWLASYFVYWVFSIAFYSLLYRGTMCIYMQYIYIWEGRRAEILD